MAIFLKQKIAGFRMMIHAFFILVCTMLTVSLSEPFIDNPSLYLYIVLIIFLVGALLMNYIRILPKR